MEDHTRRVHLSMNRVFVHLHQYPPNLWSTKLSQRSFGSMRGAASQDLERQTAMHVALADLDRLATVDSLLTGKRLTCGTAFHAAQPLYRDCAEQLRSAIIQRLGQVDSASDTVDRVSTLTRQMNT